MSLLFKTKPIVINADLAKAIGLNEAIILQQLNYWISGTGAGITHKGDRWVYNTYEEWQEQFPFWSPETIKRTLTSLKKAGLIKVEQLDKHKHNRTNFYAVDYAAVAKLEPTHRTEQNDLIEQVNMTSSKGSTCSDLTEITTETNSETKSLCADAFELFWSAGMTKINKKKAFAIFKRIAGEDPMAFAQRLQADIQARLRAEQMGFDAMHPTTYLNGERWNDEIKQGTAAKPNARLSPLEQYEADLRERDAQRATSGMAMGQDDRDLWGDMAAGAGQDTYIDLDTGDWETRGE